MRTQTQAIVKLVSLFDLVLLVCVLTVVWRPALSQSSRELFVVLLLAPLWVLFLDFGGVYRSHRLEGFSGFLRSLLSAQLLAVVGFSSILLATGLRHRFRQLALVLLVGTIGIVLERALLYSLLFALRKRGFDSRNVCVIGDLNTAGRMMERFAENQAWGLRVTSVGAGDPAQRRFFTFPDNRPLASGIEELLRTEVVDEVLIAVPQEKLSQERFTLMSCRDHGIIARVLLDAPDDPPTTLIEGFCGQMSMTLGGVRSHGALAMVKRGIDLTLGSLLLLVCSPLMIVTAVLVKLSSPGPIFFRQLRTGLHGRAFMMYKFRTMIDGAEGMVQSLAHLSITKGPIFKNPTDCRITPVGRVLRRFSLDELPQFLNVVQGDMSLVGPRPLPLHEAAAISGVRRRRFSMKPGITCLWQINGRSEVEFGRWMNYDLQYVDNWSLWLDAKLIAQTIPAILLGRGAY